MSVLARAQALQDYIRQGKIVEAMQEFYAPDVRMQENRHPPTIGLGANLDRERAFMSQVKEFKGYEVNALAVAGDVSMVESALDIVNQQGEAVHMEQVAVQRWHNGKIIAERFYYDSARK